MRRNQNNQSIFKRTIALAMGLAVIGGYGVPATAAGTNAAQQQSQQTRKDAVQEKHTPVRPVSSKSKFHGAGDSNPYKYTRTPKKNQRQVRKYWRQNPHIKTKYK
jgi:hypothetical protein